MPPESLPSPTSPSLTPSTLTITPLLCLPGSCLFLSPLEPLSSWLGVVLTHHEPSVGLSKCGEPQLHDSSHPAEDRTPTLCRLPPGLSPPVLPSQDSPSSMPALHLRGWRGRAHIQDTLQRTMAPTPVWPRTPRGRCPAAPASLSRVGASGQPSRSTFPAHLLWRKGTIPGSRQVRQWPPGAHSVQGLPPETDVQAQFSTPHPTVAEGRCRGKRQRLLGLRSPILIGRTPHPLEEDEFL